MGEDERCTALVRRANQKCNADSNGSQNIDRREPEDDLMQLLRSQGAYGAKDDKHQK